MKLMHGFSAVVKNGYAFVNTQNFILIEYKL